LYTINNNNIQYVIFSVRRDGIKPLSTKTAESEKQDHPSKLFGVLGGLILAGQAQNLSFVTGYTIPHQ
jgi:hypothetical protein